MESTRTHTFRIILLLAVFACGFVSGKTFMAHKNKDRGQKQAYPIQRQRIMAINKAVAEGKDSYEFEVGYNPILNK